MLPASHQRGRRFEEEVSCDLRLISWNVNGVRARFGELVRLAAEREPDVLCLQEIKATAAQVPEPLTGLPAYWSHWHGAPGGYSGVSLHVARRLAPERPTFTVPAFDFENRIACVEIPGRAAIASVYVPNGAARRATRAATGSAFARKLRFLDELAAWVEGWRGPPLVVAGDLNVALTDNDLHPRHRSPGSIGQRPEERERLARAISPSMIDVIRARWPEADDVFTWWPPWREEKAKNRGWRIDFVLASASSTAGRVEILRDFGSSDHAPVLVEVE
jgi:exodeoxyribonuclease-3